MMTIMPTRFDQHQGNVNMNYGLVRLHITRCSTKFQVYTELQAPQLL